MPAETSSLVVLALKVLVRLRRPSWNARWIEGRGEGNCTGRIVVDVLSGASLLTFSSCRRHAVSGYPRSFHPRCCATEAIVGRKHILNPVVAVRSVAIGRLRRTVDGRIELGERGHRGIDAGWADLTGIGCSHGRNRISVLISPPAESGSRRQCWNRLRLWHSPYCSPL